MYKVTGEFCIEGNPTIAWSRVAPEPDENGLEQRLPPNDVWQAQVHEFGSLDEAKAFVKGLYENDPNGQMFTHVAIENEEGEVLVHMDSDFDHLDDADDGVIPPSQRPPEPLPGEHVVDETLTPFASQEA
jgi:hypothetical protein